jgi:hypothetical protein
MQNDAVVGRARYRTAGSLGHADFCASSSREIGTSSYPPFLPLSRDDIFLVQSPPSLAVALPLVAIAVSCSSMSESGRLSLRTCTLRFLNFSREMGTTSYPAPFLF